MTAAAGTAKIAAKTTVSGQTAAAVKTAATTTKSAITTTTTKVATDTKAAAPPPRVSPPTAAGVAGSGLFARVVPLRLAGDATDEGDSMPPSASPPLEHDPPRVAAAEVAATAVTAAEVAVDTSPSPPTDTSITHTTHSYGGVDYHLGIQLGVPVSGVVWDSADTLCRYLVGRRGVAAVLTPRPRPPLRSRTRLRSPAAGAEARRVRVLEVGAGTGLPSLVAATLLGGDDSPGSGRGGGTTPDPPGGGASTRALPAVVATDVASALPLLRANVASNGLRGRVGVEALVWGTPPGGGCAGSPTAAVLPPLLRGPWDLLLASDVVYSEAAGDNDVGDEGDNDGRGRLPPPVLLAHEHRSNREAHFFHLADVFFDVRRLATGGAGGGGGARRAPRRGSTTTGDGGVCLYRLRRRRRRRRQQEHEEGEGGHAAGVDADASGMLGPSLRCDDCRAILAAAAAAGEAGSKGGAFLDAAYATSGPSALPSAGARPPPPSPWLPSAEAASASASGAPSPSPSSTPAFRSRGAKRGAAHAAAATYAAHFTALLAAELDAEVAIVAAATEAAAAEDGGLVGVGGLRARPRPPLFGDPVFELSLPSKGGGTQAASTPLGLAFAKGDVVALARDFGAPPPRSAAAATAADGERRGRRGGQRDRRGGRSRSLPVPLASPPLDGDEEEAFTATIYRVRPAALDVVLPCGSAGAVELGATTDRGGPPRGGPRGGGGSPTHGRWRVTPTVNSIGYARARDAVAAAAAASMAAGGIGGDGGVPRLLVRSFSAAAVATAAAVDGGAERVAAAGGDPPWGKGPDTLAAAAAPDNGAAWEAIARQRPFGAPARSAHFLPNPPAGKPTSGDSADPPPPLLSTPPQAAAAAAATSRSVTLIAGPPGTGKTATAGEVVRRLAAAAGRGAPVLATAASHVAADHLARAVLAAGVPRSRVVRLGKAAAMGEDLWGVSLDARTNAAGSGRGGGGGRGGRSVRGGRGGGSGRGGRNSGRARADAAAAYAARIAATDAVLRSASVVVTTCVGAGHEALAAVRVSAVVIDEATQATEADALIPLFLPGRDAPPPGGRRGADPGCPPLVLVGDDRQLPPTVLSEVAASGGLGVSLYRRLRGVGVRVSPLRVQYRMHPGVAVWPAATFYGGGLVDGVNAADRPLPRPWRRGGALFGGRAPVTFVDVAGGGGERRGGVAGGGGGQPVLPPEWRRAEVAAAEASALASAAASQAGTGAAMASLASGAPVAVPVPGSMKRAPLPSTAVAAAAPLMARGQSLAADGGGGAQRHVPPLAGGVPPVGNMASFSYRNDAEVAAITALVTFLVSSPRGEPGAPVGSAAGLPVAFTAADIGIITPYAAQVRAITRALAATGASTTTAPVEVATVDGFQGREKPLILLSLVRSNAARRVGFVADPRRANVALTRARAGVVVVGDAATLAGCELWAHWLDWVATEGRVVGGGELWEVLGKRGGGRVEGIASAAEDADGASREGAN
ncbi:hypothetical protein MMPV_002695 [Pyropia vietnamensis]